MCPGLCGRFFQAVDVKFCLFRFIWLILLAKRTYTEVVSGHENPDDCRSWMRAYQQESEDALKEAIKLSKVYLTIIHRSGGE